MPSEARPLLAIASVEARQAATLGRLALKSPTLMLGGAVLALFVGARLVQKLGLVELSPGQLAATGATAGLLLGLSAARSRATALEGPFGFVLMQPQMRLLNGLRRAGLAVAALLLLFGLLMLVARPEEALLWAGAASLGAFGGGLVGTVLSGLLPMTAPGRTGAVDGRFSRLAPLTARVLLWIALIAGALRTGAQDATGPAQLFAALALAVAVLPSLPVEPKTLNLRAVTPLSLPRLILPLAFTPAALAGLAGLASGWAAGLTPGLILGLALVVSALAGAARIFLALAALGRSEAAARTAGGVELAIAGVMPAAGPAAIGPLAALWVLARFAWLWRRGARVRWLDPEGGR